MSTPVHPSCVAARHSRRGSDSFPSVARRIFHRGSVGTSVLVVPTGRSGIRQFVVLVDIGAAEFVQESSSSFR